MAIIKRFAIDNVHIIRSIPIALGRLIFSFFGFLNYIGITRDALCTATLFDISRRRRICYRRGRMNYRTKFLMILEQQSNDERQQPKKMRILFNMHTYLRL